MIPLIPILASLAGVGGLAAAEQLTTPKAFDPSGSGTASPPHAVPSIAVLRRLMPIHSNDSALPTAEQIAAYVRLKGPAPEPIVPRVRTPFPDSGPNGTKLTAFMEACGAVCGSREGGAIMCVLASIETWAGVHSNVACYNHNAGNQKNPRGHAGPAYFLVDRVPSLDFYPSFDTWDAGIRAWYSLLCRPHYNKPGMMGAREALRQGDIVAFNEALGAGGYAAFYTHRAAMNGRARVLMQNGALPPGAVRL